MVGSFIGDINITTSQHAQGKSLQIYMRCYCDNCQPSLAMKGAIMSKATYRSFRPWPDNQKRLELADRLGLNVSEVINEVLEDKFDDVLRKKSRKIQEALQAVPA